MSIDTLTAGGGYGTITGTSVSAAEVAGVAALIMANDPSATNGQVVYRLGANAEDAGTRRPDRQRPPEPQQRPCRHLDRLNEAGIVPNADPVEEPVADPYVAGAGGAYTLNFSAADPSIYIPPVPFPADLTAPTGRGDGEPLVPLAQYNDDATDVKVESLAPQDMALGQIVPFETKITVSGDTTPENGVITFVIGWNTLTTNSGDFGYNTPRGRCRIRRDRRVHRHRRRCFHRCERRCNSGWLHLEPDQ